jgi:hypothetical protein
LVRAVFLLVFDQSLQNYHYNYIGLIWQIYHGFLRTYYFHLQGRNVMGRNGQRVGKAENRLELRANQ